MDGLVTCGLTAYTPGSALGPTLSKEYGRTLPLPYLNIVLGTMLIFTSNLKHDTLQHKIGWKEHL